MLKYTDCKIQLFKAFSYQQTVSKFSLGAFHMRENEKFHWGSRSSTYTPPLPETTSGNQEPSLTSSPQTYQLGEACCFLLLSQTLTVRNKNWLLPKGTMADTTVESHSLGQTSAPRTWGSLGLRSGRGGRERKDLCTASDNCLFKACLSSTIHYYFFVIWITSTYFCKSEPVK